MQISRTLRSAAVLLVAATGLSCDAGEHLSPLDGQEPVVFVSVTPDVVQTEIDLSVTLTAVARSASGSVIRGRPVAWRTTDPRVAAVSPAGTLVGISVGQVAAVAEVDGVSAAAQVFVVEETVAVVSVTPAQVSVASGDSTTMAVKLTSASGKELKGRSVKWETEDSGVADIDGSGKVKGRSAGQTKVIARSGGKSDTSIVRVTPTPIVVVRVVITPSVVTLPALGATTQLAAQSFDSIGSIVGGEGIGWSSSNSSVATVDASGMVTARNVGTALIIATSLCCGAADTSSVTVQPVVASVRVNPSSLNLSAGDSAQITAEPLDSNGNKVAGATLTWTGSAPAIATVSGAGLVKALSAGSASITASSGGRAASVPVQVTTAAGQVVRVVASHTADTIRSIGASAKYSAVAYDATNQPVQGTTLTWTSLSPAIATVDNMGQTIARAAGIALITVSVACCSASDTLKVVVDPAVDTVVVTPDRDAIEVGQQVDLDAKAYDANGNVMPGAHVSWSSTSPSVATVDSSGFVSGIAAGLTTIRAISSGHTGSAVISVSSAPPPPPPPPVNYQVVIGDDWQYGSKAELQAAGGFWWDRSENVWDHVALTSDPTFGKAVRIRFAQSNETGFAPRYNAGLPTPLDKVWYRFRVKWQPGFTTAGLYPSGHANSWKMAFWTWDGYNARGQIEFSNTTEYIPGFHVTDQASGQTIPYTESYLPGTAADFGRVTTEWSDGEWWEYVIYYEKTGPTSARQRWWRRRLTSGGTIVNNAFLYLGREYNGSTTPRVRAIDLGANKNKNNPSDLYLWWGPWEVVNGSVYPNPFGMPNM